MTTFPEIAARLRDGNLTPDEIASYRSFCAGSLYRMYEQYGKCLSFGAEWRTEIKNNPVTTSGKPMSEAELERIYSASGPGKEETHLKYQIKGVEALETVLTSLYFQTNKEMQLANRE